MLKAAFTAVPRTCSLCGLTKLGGREQYSKLLRKLLWVCTACQEIESEEAAKD